MDPYSVIQKLLRNSHEFECLELKEAKENFDFSKLGKYFSALCNEAKRLKKLGLVEGRYPNLYVTASVAEMTGDKTDYIKNRAFDNQYYKNMIIQFLETYHSASRKEIDQLLLDKLSTSLSEEQKRKKVGNLLTELSVTDGKIRNDGTKKQPIWKLV